MNPHFKTSLLEIKTRARVSILGHFRTLIPAIIMYYLFTFMLNQMVLGAFTGSSVFAFLGTELLSILIMMFRGILLYGVYYLFMGLQYAQEVRFTDLYRGFVGKTDRMVKVQGVITGLSFLCGLPALIFTLVLPDGKLLSMLPWVIVLLLLGKLGEYIVMLHFRMCYFLMMDFPDMDAKDILQTGLRLMKNHKLELFRMDLGFLPLYLLSLLSLGIASLWVEAYHHASSASFYRYITENK